MMQGYDISKTCCGPFSAWLDETKGLKDSDNLWICTIYIIIYIYTADIEHYLNYLYKLIYIYIYTIHSNQLFKHHCHHCRHQPPALDIRNSRRGGRVSSDSQWGLPEVWERSSSWSRYEPRMQCGLWSHGTSLDDVFFAKILSDDFDWVCWGR